MSNGNKKKQILIVILRTIPIIIKDLNAYIFLMRKPSRHGAFHWQILPCIQRRANANLREILPEKSKRWNNHFMTKIIPVPKPDKGVTIKFYVNVTYEHRGKNPKKNINRVK